MARNKNTDNRRSKKARPSRQTLLAAFVLVASLMLAGGNMVSAFSNQQEAVPQNPIVGISGNSSRVLYTGEGYVTSDIRATKEAREIAIVAEVLQEPISTQEDQGDEDKSTDEGDSSQGQEEIAGEEGGEDGDTGSAEGTGTPAPQEPVTKNYENGNGEDPQANHPDIPDDNNNQEGADTPTPTPTPDPDEGRYPQIYTNLENGMTVNASFFTIQVEAYDYKNRGITAEGVTVYGNETLLYPTSAAGATSLTYRLDLQEVNEVYVLVTDRYGLSSQTEVYTIYMGDDSQQTPAGTIALSVKASTIGLGYLISPTAVDYYQGEQLPEVLLRTLDACGYGYKYGGTPSSSFYLEGITRPGLLEGWDISYIPTDLLAHLEDENDPPSLPGSINELGEFVITGNSGWMYYVNGESYGSGMGTYYPADGDEVELKFSLFKGADTGGAMEGDTWEKEW